MGTIQLAKIPKEELESKTDRYDVMIDGEWDSSWDRKSDAVARVKALKQDPKRREAARR